jgi:hypothetical protein
VYNNTINITKAWNLKPYFQIKPSTEASRKEYFEYANSNGKLYIKLTADYLKAKIQEPLVISFKDYNG